MTILKLAIFVYSFISIFTANIFSMHSLKTIRVLGSLNKRKLSHNNLSFSDNAYSTNSYKIFVCNGICKSLKHSGLRKFSEINSCLACGSKVESNLNALLHYAAENNDLELAVYLVESGADINSSDSLLQTPLIKAIKNFNIDLAKCLVKNGANVNYIDLSSSCAVKYACEIGNIDLINFLVKNGASLENKYFIDNICEEGTVLQDAVLREDFELIKCLASNGANLDIKDSNNNSLLDYAALSKNSDILKFLVVEFWRKDMMKD